MPYIDPDDREEMTRRQPVSIGELNYAITMLCKEFLGFEATYYQYNEIVGVLECAKLEFYRRAVAVYEDGTIKKNGDVY